MRRVPATTVAVENL